MSLNHVIGDHIHSLHSIAERLNFLAQALGIVGLEKMADELSFTADQLPPLCTELRSAFRDDLNGHVAASQENVALLLKATLAGAIQPPKRKAVQP